MRIDYGDIDEFWAELAHDRGVRLPRKETPCTTGKMEAWLKKCKVSVSQYKEITGFKSIKEFIIRNPELSLRAWAGGTVLECLYPHHRVK